MYELFVYIILDQKRLVVTKEKHDNNSNYVYLIAFSNNDKILVDNLASIYCQAVLLGNQINYKLINTFDEFIK